MPFEKLNFVRRPVSKLISFKYKFQGAIQQVRAHNEAQTWWIRYPNLDLDTNTKNNVPVAMRTDLLINEKHVEIAKTCRLPFGALA